MAASLLGAACGSTGGQPSDGDAAPSPSAASSTAPPTLQPGPSSTATTTIPPDRRAEPRDPVVLAEELSEAERAIRNPAVTDGEAAIWGRRQQRLYRVLARNEAWADTVLAGAAPDVADAVARNWQARLELSRLVNSGSLSGQLPAWRIEAPLPREELLSYYREAEAATGIGWEYLAAINLVETRMGRIEGLSTAGATGPMQFLPSTWEECCEGDPTDDRDAILGAGVYLRARGGPADMDAALYGYNNSAYYVAAVNAYAEVLRDDPMALRGYHAWEVYFASAAGLVRLPIGYEQAAPVDAAAWIAANPEYVLSDR